MGRRKIRLFIYSWALLTISSLLPKYTIGFWENSLFVGFPFRFCCTHEQLFVFIFCKSKFQICFCASKMRIFFWLYQRDNDDVNNVFLCLSPAVQCLPKESFLHLIIPCPEGTEWQFWDTLVIVLIFFISRISIHSTCVIIGWGLRLIIFVLFCRHNLSSTLMFWWKKVD